MAVSVDVETPPSEQGGYIGESVSGDRASWANVVSCLHQPVGIGQRDAGVAESAKA